MAVEPNFSAWNVELQFKKRGNEIPPEIQLVLRKINYGENGSGGPMSLWLVTSFNKTACTRGNMKEGQIILL